jgi:hypothetical protein
MVLADHGEGDHMSTKGTRATKRTNHGEARRALAHCVKLSASAIEARDWEGAVFHAHFAERAARDLRAAMGITLR